MKTRNDFLTGVAPFIEINASVDVVVQVLREVFTDGFTSEFCITLLKSTDAVDIRA